MKVAGIIAEYNPFHSGHQYHIKRTKELTGCDFTVAVMSGDFVQRGAPALADKYVRAQMALSCGADLVLELPVLYACASAEFFAWGGVALLDALSLTDVLSFGAELDDARLFWQVSGLLAREGGAFSRRLQEGLREGLSFPAARAQALLAGLPRGEAGELPRGGSAELPPEGNAGLPLGGNAELPPEGSAGLALENSLPQIRALLSSPNNLLGLEYCKALHVLGSPIRPLPVLRQGHAYHDSSLAPEGFASASAIRRGLLAHWAERPRSPQAGQRPAPPADSWEGLDGSPLPAAAAAQLPAACAALLREHWGQCLPVEETDFSLPVHLRLLAEKGRYETYADFSAPLARRAARLLPQYASLPAFTQALKTKNYTYTRAARSLLHLLLGITCEDMKMARQLPLPVPYCRILGFRKEAAPLLSQLRKASRIPLLTKMADARQALNAFYPPREAALAQRMLELDISAANLYEAVVTGKFHTVPKNEYTRGVLRV